MGIRDALAFGVMSAAWVLVMFVIGVMLRAPPPSRVMRFVAIAASAFMVASVGAALIL